MAESFRLELPGGLEPPDGPNDEYMRTVRVRVQASCLDAPATVALPGGLLRRARR